MEEFFPGCSSVPTFFLRTFRNPNLSPAHHLRSVTYPTSTYPFASQYCSHPYPFAYLSTYQRDICINMVGSVSLSPYTQFDSSCIPTDTPPPWLMTVSTHPSRTHRLRPQNRLLSQARQLGTRMHHITYDRIAIGMSTALQVLC